MPRIGKLMLVVVVVLAVGVGVWALASDNGNDDTKHRTASPTSTAPTTTSVSTLASTVPSVQPPSTSKPASGAVPPQVTVVRAGSAGGSGEVQVVWSGVSGATGYRVLRASVSGGPYSTAVELDVATGTSTKASGVVNVFTSADGFVLVEVISDQPTNPHHYYKVIVFSAAGDGPPSAVVCGAPIGYPAC